ncbi:MAG: hypothetical protein ACAI43_19525 [Phycisphaerae bacterium]|nr:hypothetical protein [Tepidisphaeraceae bacterium]
MVRKMLAGVLVVVGALLSGGCKDDKPAHAAAVPTTAVPISSADLKPDGSLTDGGVSKIAAQSAAPHVTVVFSRVPVSDRALPQIAKFPNVKRIDAAGGRITAAGAEKFKQTNPDVDVAR